MKTARYRAFMITATLEFETLDSLEIKAKIVKNSQYAVILHDKDMGSKHLHLAITLDVPITINALAKKLDVKPNFIQKWDRRTDNLWGYLVHQTDKAIGIKVKYDDYLSDNTKFRTNISKFESLVVRKNTNIPIKQIVQKILVGDITRKQLLAPELIGFYYDNLYKIDHAIRLRTESLKYNPPDCTTTYIFGASGTGKTTQAIKIASKQYPNSFTIASAHNDLLQDYTGEKCLIIDDFRPENFEFVELLALLDPYHRQRTHKSRYYNKPLASELIIITSIYTLEKTIAYYQGFKLSEDMKQIRRRVQTLVNMNNPQLPLIYDEQIDDYREPKPPKLFD